MGGRRFLPRLLPPQAPPLTPTATLVPTEKETGEDSAGGRRPPPSAPRAPHRDGTGEAAPARESRLPATPRPLGAESSQQSPRQQEEPTGHQNQGPNARGAKPGAREGRPASARRKAAGPVGWEPTPYPSCRASAPKDGTWSPASPTLAWAACPRGEGGCPAQPDAGEGDAAARGHVLPPPGRRVPLVCSPSFRNLRARNNSSKKLRGSSTAAARGSGVPRGALSLSVRTPDPPLPPPLASDAALGTSTPSARGRRDLPLKREIY